MKTFKALLFLVLLTTQFLPISAVGENLWNQTISEEEVHHHVVKIKAINKLWYLDFAVNSDQFDAQSKNSFLIVDEALIKCLHLEVLIQPPNRSSFSI